MTEKSVLQQKADDLRQLKASIAEYEKILPIVQKAVTDARVSLMQAEANLRDTQTLLTAQRVKLANDIQDMSSLLDMALSDIGM